MLRREPRLVLLLQARDDVAHDRVVDAVVTDTLGHQPDLLDDEVNVPLHLTRKTEEDEDGVEADVHRWLRVALALL